MPGTLGGAFIVDYLGPKYTMVNPYSSHLCLTNSLDPWPAVSGSHRFHHEWPLYTVGFRVQACSSSLTSSRLSNHIAAFAVRCSIFNFDC